MGKEWELSLSHCSLPVGSSSDDTQALTRQTTLALCFSIPNLSCPSTLRGLKAPAKAAPIAQPSSSSKVGSHTAPNQRNTNHTKGSSMSKQGIQRLQTGKENITCFKNTSQASCTRAIGTQAAFLKQHPTTTPPSYPIPTTTHSQFAMHKQENDPLGANGSAPPGLQCCTEKLPGTEPPQGTPHCHKEGEAEKKPGGIPTTPYITFSWPSSSSS